MEIGSIKAIFLRYILMPLIVGVMVFILGLIRKATPAIKLKHIIVYLLLSGLVLSLPGILGFSGNEFAPKYYLFAMLIYLSLGILNVNLLHHYFRKHFQKMTKAILFDSIFSVTCLLLGGFLFSLLFKWISKDIGNPYYAATSMLIFFVPLLFYYCYIQFISIPFDIYKTWKFDPEKKPHTFQGVDFDKLMVLNVELSKNSEDEKRFNIKAKTLPTGITFGDWFHRVVDDYNHKNPGSPIKLTDEHSEPYYWIFYIKKSFFSIRKYIDFEQDVMTNKISENETIICKRVISNLEEGK